MKAAFKETAINVTVQGQRHLGAVIGSREYVEEYVNDKVTNWISKITKLAEFTDSTSSILCGIHLWIKPSMDLFPESSARHSRLECNVVISSIPSLPLQIGSGANWTDKLAFPAHLGGLGVENPSSYANLKCTSSVKRTVPIIEQIMSQVHQLPKIP